MREENGRWMNEALQIGAKTGWGYDESLAHYVEIELVSNLSGPAIGAAINEETRKGINQWKRGRLISAGANALIADLEQALNQIP